MYVCFFYNAANYNKQSLLTYCVVIAIAIPYHILRREKLKIIFAGSSRHRSAPFSTIMSSSSSSTSLAGAVGLWWVASALATIASRRLIQGEPLDSLEDSPEDGSIYQGGMGWVELSLLQQAVGVLLAVTWGTISREVVCSEDVFCGQFGLILFITIGNVAGSLATNAAFFLGASDVNLAILSCQPLVTLLLSSFLYRQEQTSHKISKLPILVIVLGAILFVFGEPDFNTWTVSTAVISNIAFPVRNILMKRLSGECSSSPLQNFTITSIYSVMFLTPVYLVKRVVFGGSKMTAFSERSMISSFFYSVYSIASVTVLNRVLPVTHAVLGLGQRLFFSLASILRFSVPFSTNMTFGLCIILVGFYLYQQKNTRWLWAKKCSVFVVLMYFSLILVRQADQPVYWLQSIRRTECTFENKASTAWIYDRLIPSEVVKNIEAVVQNNPAMSLHVYCGTSQCVDAVSSSLWNDRIHVEFAVVSEILKDTPLEQWVVSHPFNKLLARGEYEDHLQEAVRLGLLWKHGGYYISPTVLPTQHLFPPLCRESSPARMLGGTDMPKERITSIFDAVYFPKRHPLIHQLFKDFASTYPLKGHTYAPFSFPYANRVWERIKGNATCPSCPDPTPSLQLKYINITEEEHRCHYGTLSFVTRAEHIQASNLGDELQGFPGLQFLPFLDYFVDRETLESGPPSPSNGDPITIFFNGWWGPAYHSWPPPGHLDPVMVSIHIQRDMVEPWVNYSRTREPIGCRDNMTLNLMQSHGVDAFLSGCMTLLLKNPNIRGVRRDKIYFVDVRKKYLDSIPHDIREKGVKIRQAVSLNSTYNLERFSKAYKLIQQYASAKLVITQRIHAALPCVAMGTPVLFISSAKMPGGGGTNHSHPPRVGGLTKLFHTFDVYNSNEDSNVTRSKLDDWLKNFPYDNPPPNPNPGLFMRLRASTWNVIRRRRALRDAGKKFRVIPFQPPDSMLDDKKFHLIFTASHLMVREDPNGGRRIVGLKWRHWRSVESIFYHHPASKVIVHCNALPLDTFDVLTESGYSISVERYDLEEMLLHSPSDNFLEGITAAKRNDPSYSHYVEADLLRLLVLYEVGGVYMDPDMILVRPVDEALPENALGWSDGTNSTLSTKFMIFEDGNNFLRSSLEVFSKHYSSLGAGWTAANGLGNLLTSVWRDEEEEEEFRDVTVLPHHFFYNAAPSGSAVHSCFTDTKGKDFEASMNIIRRVAYSVSLDFNLSGHATTGVQEGVGQEEGEQRLAKETVCGHLLNSFCVLCSNIIHLKGH